MIKVPPFSRHTPVNGIRSRNLVNPTVRGRKPRTESKRSRMAVKATCFVNLALAGVLTGNEFGEWAGWVPVLRTLPLAAHMQAEQAVTRRYGAIMPFMKTAAIASCIPVVSLIRDKRSAVY